MSRLDTKFVIAIIILALILGALFLVYYINASRNMTAQDVIIADQRSQIASYSNQVKSISDQLNSANTRNKELADKLATATAQIATIQSKLDSANSQSTALQSQLTSANDQVSSLKNQLTSSNAQISSLQGQLADANSQISSLKSQVTAVTSESYISNLQAKLDVANAQITSNQTMLSLMAWTNLIDNAPFQMNSGQEMQVASFSAGYAGYIAIKGRSSTASSYIRSENIFSGSPLLNRNAFRTGDTVIIPVLPGTINIYLGNTDPSGNPTANLTIVYYY
jgi:predicted  nucleic acid-binding Zn-ribbon protein